MSRGTFGNRGTGVQLRSLMATQPDAPCVTHQCPRAAECAFELLACEAYAAYLERGETRAPSPEDQPTGERYDLLFTRVDPPLPPKKFTLVP